MHSNESLNLSSEHLLAENQRLVHLLNKLSGFNSESSTFEGDSMRLPTFLPLAISQILISSSSFDYRMNEVLRHLGDFTSVSRVYIFEDSDEGHFCSNTYEWCNNGVVPQKSLLQKVDYNAIPSWKKILKEKGSIESSLIEQELPKELLKLLIPQGIKSILVFPLLIGHKFIGFIGFDECSFHRRWTEMEKALLATVARLVGNAYQQDLSLSQIRSSLQTRQFLFDIAFQLHQQGTLNETLTPVAVKMIETWNLDAFAFYSNLSENANEFTLTASSVTIGKYVDFPEVVCFKEKFVLPLIPSEKSLSEQLPYNHAALINALGFPSERSLLTGIRTYNGPNGLMFLQWADDQTECPVEPQMLETLGGMISRYLDHRKADVENRIKHEQILEINHQLAQKEHFLNNIILAAPIGIILVKDRVIQYVNDRVSQSTLYSRDELIGLHASKLYADGAESKEKAEQFYNGIVESGINMMEVRFKKKDNGILYYQLVGTLGPDFEKDGSFLLVCQDVTKIRNIEESLNESEERNRKIIEANIDGIFIISKQGALVYVNNAGFDMSGYKHDELEQLNLNQLFPENSGKDYLKILEHLNQGGDYRGESQMCHRNGSILFVELHGTKIVLDSKEHYYFSIHDITRRKQNEAALKVSEKKFRSLSENLPDCVLRINRSGLVTFSNSLFVKMFMPRSSEIVSRHIFHIEELPEDFINGFLPALNYVLNRKEIFHLEIEHENNGEQLTFDWTLNPELDESGQCVSVLGIGRDITSRKNVERELVLAKERAEAADRLKSAFLANMSHEIRTPLNAIVGFSNLLGETDPDGADREEFVSLINKSADNLMALINDIIDIAKIESGHLIINKKAVNVSEILKAIYETYLSRIESQFNGKVEFRLSMTEAFSAPMYVDAEPIRLLQILNNLLDNAIKFTNEGFIELGCSIENQKVRFSVRDTGIGVAPENQKMIFEAFRQEEESTSKTYGGTGLGLSICKKLVEAMAGQMGLKSEKGKGAEFFFYLNMNTSTGPIKEEAPEMLEIMKETQSEVFPNWSNRMLLMVYENSSVHMLMKKHFEKTGITILSARSGAAARRLLMTRKDIDVAIMDQFLPDSNAEELALALRAAEIQIPLLVQVEDQSNGTVRELIEAGVDECFSRSITNLDLINKIRTHFNVGKVVI
jgi:PAS domain S-box-containing protein